MQLRNVLILHSAALGDFIVTWPLVLALGRIHAQSRIIVVTQSQKGALAEAALRVESTNIESGWSQLFSGGELPEKPRRMLESSHSVYSFISGTEDIATKSLRRVAPRATVKTLTSKPPAGFGRHTTEYIIDQLSDQPMVATAMQQMLKSIADRGLGLADAKGQDIVVHPGSGARAKNWLPANFVELIERLRSAGKTVRTILGEAELEKMPAEVFAAFGKLEKPPTLLDLFKSLRNAGAYIGNDSGPSHLAGMIGLPTLALFGPSDPNVWRPLGPRVKVLQREPLDSLSVDEVYEAAMSMMGG